MSKNLRSLATRLNLSVKRLFNVSQKEIQMPVSVSLDFELKTTSAGRQENSVTIIGRTVKMSKDGIEFIVPFVRVGEHHLAGHGGEQQRLKLVLELAAGTVRFTVVANRYEMIEVHDSVQNYLLGAKIVAISEGDAERYENFLRGGDKSPNQEDSAGIILNEKKRSLLNHFSIF